MSPLTTSDLIFSEQANHNFSKTLGEIKRHTLSIHNRLHSILEDAAFVQTIHDAYQRPLIANERCGSWYINPKYKDGSAYFKSTDGHTRAWSFSTRRLNTHLIKLIGEHDGCIIVDSTRRMPDALSKTIPIWCSVINRALFPDMSECHDLHTSPQAVSSSEHSQITERLDSFLKSFLLLHIDLGELRLQINKPLRPIWVTPGSHISPSSELFEHYHPIICCTASRRVQGGEISEGGYIQGSGDDTENWALGLTPAIFWAHTQILLSVSEMELPELIPKLVVQAMVHSQPQPQSIFLECIPPTTSLYVTTLENLRCQAAQPGSIRISLHPGTTLSATEASPQELNIALGPHKLGSRNLRTVLSSIVNFVTQKIAQGVSELNLEHKMQIIIACSIGKDHSVGVGLALLCLFFDDCGQLGSRKDFKEFNKLFIKRRLGWIMTAMPDANPSGATLQSVNSYLMGRPR